MLRERKLILIHLTEPQRLDCSVMNKCFKDILPVLFPLQLGIKFSPLLIQVNHSLPLKFIFEVSSDLNVRFMNADFFLGCKNSFLFHDILTHIC